MQWEEVYGGGLQAIAAQHDAHLWPGALLLSRPLAGAGKLGVHGHTACADVQCRHSTGEMVIDIPSASLETGLRRSAAHEHTTALPRKTADLTHKSCRRRRRTPAVAAWMPSIQSMKVRKKRLIIWPETRLSRISVPLP